MASAYQRDGFWVCYSLAWSRQRKSVMMILHKAGAAADLFCSLHKAGDGQGGPHEGGEARLQAGSEGREPGHQDLLLHRRQAVHSLPQGHLIATDQVQHMQQTCTAQA